MVLFLEFDQFSILAFLPFYWFTAAETYWGTLSQQKIHVSLLSHVVEVKYDCNVVIWPYFQSTPNYVQCAVRPLIIVLIFLANALTESLQNCWKEFFWNCYKNSPLNYIKIYLLTYDCLGRRSILVKWPKITLTKSTLLVLAHIYLFV